MIGWWGIFLFGACFAQTTLGESFTIKPINNNAGLYIEEISELKFYHQEWKMVTHVNMTEYQSEFESLKNLVERVRSGCREFQDRLKPENASVFLKLNQHRWCVAMSQQVDVLMAVLEENNAKWWVNFENPRIKKRGLINAVGTISNILYGTLGQEDAEHYLGLFETIKLESQVRDEMLKSHTSLIESAVEFMKEEKSIRESEYAQVNVRFNQIIHHTNWIVAGINTDMRLMSVRQEIHEVSTMLIMIMMRFAQKQKKFLDAISIGQKIPNSPILVAPATFVAELHKIRNVIASGDVDLPLDISIENLALYYHISTPEVRIIKNQMIVSFSIPLVDTKLYALHKVTSLPYRIKDNLFGFILPTHDFLALDKLNEKYVYLSNEELNACHHIGESSLVCQLTNPVMNANSAKLCEISLIKKANYDKVCNVRIANFTDEVWIKLRRPNTWVYVLPNEVNIYIKCGSKVVNNLLEGTGFISIEDNCSIKSDNLIISAYKVTESHVIEGTIPSVELEDFNITMRAVFDLGNFSLPLIETPKIIENGQSNKLREMSVELRNVKKIQLERLNKWSVRNSQNTVSIIAIIVYVAILAATGYLAFRAYKKYRELMAGGLVASVVSALPNALPSALPRSLINQGAVQASSV